MLCTHPPAAGAAGSVEVWDGPARTGLAFRFGVAGGTPSPETCQVRVALSCLQASRAPSSPL